MWYVSLSLSLLTLLLLTACTTPFLEEGGSTHLMVGDPVGQCREVGNVRGSRINGGGMLPASDETGKNRMRNQATHMGANYVRLENIDETWVTGTAYRCN
jgi:hypothetical protein